MLAVCKRYCRIPVTKGQLKDPAKVKFITVLELLKPAVVESAMPFESVGRLTVIHIDCCISAHRRI
jgi:hypothetical protein